MENCAPPFFSLLRRPCLYIVHVLFFFHSPSAFPRPLSLFLSFSCGRAVSVLLAFVSFFFVFFFLLRSDARVRGCTHMSLLRLVGVAFISLYQGREGKSLHLFSFRGCASLSLSLLCVPPFSTFFFSVPLHCCCGCCCLLRGKLRCLFSSSFLKNGFCCFLSPSPTHLPRCSCECVCIIHDESGVRA